jgi:hypothetical protein
LPRKTAQNAGNIKLGVHNLFSFFVKRSARLS